MINILKRNKSFTLAMAVAFIAFIAGKLGIKSKNVINEGITTDVAFVYEMQLDADTNLQQIAEEFILPKNILDLFHKHVKQLQSFADQCYEYRAEKDVFFVEYIDDKRFYFCASDTNRKRNIEKETAIQKGQYNEITAFMDYAIENGLVFRDWMLEIHPPSPVNENRFEEKRNSNYGPSLEITLYKSRGMELSFYYFPYEDVDYSYEDYDLINDGPAGGVKIIRIDSHWYYRYVVMEWADSWYPEKEALGFSSKEEREERNNETEQLPDNPPYIAPLSPVEIFLHYTVIVGVPIIVVLFIYVLIRHYIKHKRNTK